MNSIPLPFGATIDEDGVWRQVLTRVPGPPRRPALFLDRDGVILEEVGYLHSVRDMRLVPGAAEIIATANARGVPVVVVTNQSGIGRGKYGWTEFAAVQESMLDALADRGAFVNAVLACPHIAGGIPPYNVADHAFRKPKPGMLLAAANMLPIDLAASWIVGDRAGDVDAAKRAGCAGGVHVLSGHGSADGARRAALAVGGGGFPVLKAASIADVGTLIPLLSDGEASGEDA